MEKDNNISEYLYRTWNSTRIVLLTGLITGIFYWLYEPFRSTNWGVANNRLWIFVLIVILLGMAIISISRTIMYLYGKKHNIGYTKFSIWIFSEIITMAAVYSIIPVFVKGGFSFEKFSTDFSVAIKYTPLILLIPYSISILTIIIKDQKIQINKLKEIIENNTGNNNQTNSTNLSFLDEKNEMRLSIKKENLLFLESADNYVCIWYLHNAGINKFFLRNTLKSMSSMFTGSNVLRCHRSYMVNFDHVNTITRTHDGIFIEMDNPDITNIPVSRSYAESITKYFIGN